MEQFIISPEFLNNYSSLHTRTSYQSDIQKFLEYLKDFYPNITNFESITRDHIINYRNYLVEFGGSQEDGHAPKSISRKLSALTSYFHFLVETKMLEHNPALSVKRPRREVKKPTNALTAEQVRALLDSVKTNPKAGIMHYALLMTFFTTGLRKSEILYLKKKHYREINDYKVLEYVGKGGKIGQKVVHPDTALAIDNYLLMMKDKGRELIEEDWLFQPTHNPSNPTNVNKPLNPKTINQLLETFGKRIGLNFTISPHSARATFIGELLEIGVDIYSVAREVNHSSVTTTQEYDKRRKKLSDSPVLKLKY